MKTIHRWFRSGRWPLFGHIDLPPGTHAGIGAVIVPPFGWEDVCSYRPLRFLGRKLAASGIPTLRFDLPGTGDSSGDALDAGLFDAWVASVSDAVAELRRTTGVERVAVVGVRLGAMLALLAATKHTEIKDLVLWGAAPTGRSLLRELRAFSNIERAELVAEVAQRKPVPGMEIGGFLLGPQTSSAIEALDFSSLPPLQGCRVLLLSRDVLPVGEKLIASLETAGCLLDVRNGPGYGAMMAIPHEAQPPVEAAGMIGEFLLQESSPASAMAPRYPAAELTRPAVMDGPGYKILESVHTLETEEGSAFGILTEPDPTAPRREMCVLLLNAGAVRHTGPNRMWVEAARRWAGRGIVTLRLDLAGIGEGDGELNSDIPGLYQDHLVKQIELVLESIRARTGIERFVTVGLCSGAFWAFHAAIRNRGIRKAILLNPRLFFWDPEVDRRRVIRRTVRGLTDWVDWWRLARGEVELKNLSRKARIVLRGFRGTRTGQDKEKHAQIPRRELAAAWSAIERNQSRVTMVFSADEPLLQEMEEEGHLPAETDPRIRCIRLANGGHTLRPLWAQEVVHEVLDRELDEVFESRPETLRAAQHHPAGNTHAGAGFR